MTWNEIERRIPRFPELKPISLDDAGVLEEWFVSHPTGISELTFTNPFVWRLSQSVEVSRLNQFVVVLRQGASGKVLLPPVGEGDPAEAVQTLLAEAPGNLGVTGVKIERAPQALVEKLQGQQLKIEEDRDNFDYVYRVADLANLPGRHFDGKRNQIRQCLRENACTYETIGRETITECLNLQERWCDVRRCEIDAGLSAEFRAVREVFKNFEVLRVFGGAIRVSGKIEAFAVAERLDGETAVVHFEKANPEIKGLYQVLNQLFATKSLANFEYVNREQDLGIEGLRQAKMGMSPVWLVKKFTILRR